MTLIESVRHWVLMNLPYDRDDGRILAALDEMGPRALLVHYLDWRERFVTVTPRQVSRSGAFDRSAAGRPARREAIDHLIEDIAAGRDLMRYLSRSVKVGFDLQPTDALKNLGKRRHLDLLLNDWGIHHLHISIEEQADGFVRRTDDLMFAVFRPDRVFLVDIGSHGDWAKEGLIRTIAETWPDERLVFELVGLKGGRDYTNEERRQLRQVGLTSSVQIDGRIYVAAGGISTVGTSARSSVRSAMILRTLAGFEEEATKTPRRLIEQIRMHGGIPGDPLEFEFTFFQDGFGVIETTSGVPIGLNA